MHIAIGIVSIWFVIMRGNYVRWKEFLPTMQYFAVGNLAYNFLCANYFLWQLHPDLLANHSLTEMIYTFITFPATALMFLSHYPENGTRKQKILHYAVWIFVYVAVEVLLLVRGNIIYKYGWSLGWSAAFDVLMFPMLRLHQRNPILAYILSVPIAITFIYLFDVPVATPIEDRK